MNTCEVLHETIVRDIYDVVNGLKDFDEIEWLKNRTSTGSIAKRASNLTLVFPVIVSSSLNIQTAMVVTKAIERKCAVLLQILFSSMQFSNSDDLVDYLGTFHKNLDLRGKVMDMDDLMRIMSTDEAVTITNQDAYDIVMEDMKNIKFYLDDSYSNNSINDYSIKTNAYGESYLTEAIRNPDGSVTYDANEERLNQQERNRLSRELHDNRTNAYDLRNQVDDMRDQLAAARRRNPDMKDITSINKNASDTYKNQLTQAECNKANELMPTTMYVSFVANADKNPRVTTGIIGIKAKMYPVDSADIIYRLSSKYSSNNTLFQLVRASTREISFIKDLLLVFDKTKLDAIQAAKDSNNARMFRVLERRAKISKYLQLLKRNDASPITSLVISQDEVELLKKYNGLDIERPFIARNLMDSYNLMDICIADEGLEIAKFLFDDDSGVYETLTFDSLEKEAKDSSYKKVVNLMSKMNR